MISLRLQRLADMLAGLSYRNESLLPDKCGLVAALLLDAGERVANMEAAVIAPAVAGELADIVEDQGDARR